MSPIESISDYDKIELLTFYAVHCDGVQERKGPVHIWEILKVLQKQGVSERRARDAIDYLKSMAYITNERDNSNMYKVTDSGLSHMKAVLISNGLMDKKCLL